MSELALWTRGGIPKLNDEALVLMLAAVEEEGAAAGIWGWCCFRGKREAPTAGRSPSQKGLLRPQEYEVTSQTPACGVRHGSGTLYPRYRVE